MRVEKRKRSDVPMYPNNQQQQQKMEQEKNIKRRTRNSGEQEHKNLIQFVGHVLVCFFGAAYYTVWIRNILWIY